VKDELADGHARVFPARLRDLAGLKAFSLRFPHPLWSDLRGRRLRAVSR
jgi:hypothetical protein